MSKVLADAVEKGVESSIKTIVESLLKNIAKVELAIRRLLLMIRRHSYLQAGLDLIYSESGNMGH